MGVRVKHDGFMVEVWVRWVIGGDRTVVRNKLLLLLLPPPPPLLLLPLLLLPPATMMMTARSSNGTDPKCVAKCY